MTSRRLRSQNSPFPFKSTQQKFVVCKFIFSGKLRSGKDYCAEAINAQPISFSQPIVSIAKSLIGDINKEELRSRRLLQLIGAWGRGATEENMEELRKLQLPSRSKIIEFVKANGANLFPSINLEILKGFGSNPDIWIEITKTKIASISGKLAIVNARFPNELTTFTNLGFKHFHIMCSQKTRLARPGAGLGEADVTESMAQMYDTMLNDNTVIWNDSTPIPVGKKYITIKEFTNRYK